MPSTSIRPNTTRSSSGPVRRRSVPIDRVTLDPAGRSRWIEAFYVAEAQAELGHQSSGRHSRRPS